jgi:MFS transporter, DHA1 family, multidrug resistance protein
MSQTLSKKMILLTVILMDLLAGFEFDIIVPSFPQLQHLFALSPFWVEAMLSANFAGYCISLFFVGILADHYGRKPIILLGLLVFVSGCIICLLVPVYSVFLLGRFLQGAGIAAPAILSFLIVADMYPLKQQQFLLAMLNGAMNISVGLAPVLGSYITLYFHWEGNFITLLLGAFLILSLTLIFIPTVKRRSTKELQTLSSYIPVFQNKPLVLLIVSLFFTFVPYWVFVGISPLLYMKDLGVSLKHFGYYQGSFAVIFGIGSIMYGLMLHKFDNKKILYLTLLLYTFGITTLALAVFSRTNAPLLITLAFMPFVIGQIFTSTLLYPVALNFDPQAKGRASAIMQGGRLILTSVCLQIAGYFYTGTFYNIGIMLIIMILIAIVTMYSVLQNRALMKFALTTTH